jgi:hypothetical protein
VNRFEAFTDYELNTLALALFEFLPPDGDEPKWSQEMTDTGAHLYGEVYETEKARAGK